MQWPDTSKKTKRPRVEDYSSGLKLEQITIPQYDTIDSFQVLLNGEQ
jgi:hypothetical protein